MRLAFTFLSCSGGGGGLLRKSLLPPSSFSFHCAASILKKSWTHFTHCRTPRQAAGSKNLREKTEGSRQAVHETAAAGRRGFFSFSTFKRISDDLTANVAHRTTAAAAIRGCYTAAVLPVPFFKRTSACKCLKFFKHFFEHFKVLKIQRLGQLRSPARTHARQPPTN